MELSDACMLSEGEEIIFDDGKIGRNKKLVLTNKRLIFLQSKGRINRTYQKEDEIPIEDIESARYDPEFGAIMLQLKNGEKEVIDLVGSDSPADILMETNSEISEVRLQATTDRWVNEINRLAVKVPKMIYCKYCGAKNKPTETKCMNCGALLS
jgi:hypothetical protein